MIRLLVMRMQGRFGWEFSVVNWKWRKGWMGRKRIEKEWHKVENPKAHWRL